ncbi:MAG: ShlB/FhaC/HecB family hemolysin secretion/activation protein [Sphingobium sp.]
MRVGHLTSFVLGLLACSLSAVGEPLHAQEATSADAPVIGAIRFEGIENNQLDSMMARVETYVGMQADGDTLHSLATAVTRQAKERGYIFASVSVPPQSVRIGIVTVNFDPGMIDEVRITGSGNPRLKKILAPLQGQPGQKTVVERQLLLAQDLPGITIENTRYIKEGERGILVVEASEDRAEANIAVDNWGSDSYGPVRLRVGAQISQLLSDADTLSLSGTTTVLQPKELAYASVQYATTIGSGGAQIGATAGAGRTQPGAQPAGVSIEGENRSASLFARTPLRRTVDSSLWVNAEIAYLKVDQELVDSWVQEDKSTSFTVSLSGSQAVAGGRLNWGIGVVRGLDLLGASHSGDPFLSRADGSGLFTKQMAWFNWYRNVGGGLSIRIAGSAQHASRGLLAAHELGYGGAFFGRGYDFSEISGDDGAMGLIEIQRSVKLPWPAAKWAHVYAFADGAWLDNKDDVIMAGSLYSAGIGARAGIGPFEIGMEGAFPLKRAPYGQSDLDPRFNFVLGYGL